MEVRKIEVGVHPRNRLSWDSFFMLEYVILIWFDTTNIPKYDLLMQLCMITGVHFGLKKMLKIMKK